MQTISSLGNSKYSLCKQQTLKTLHYRHNALYVHEVGQPANILCYPRSFSSWLLTVSQFITSSVVLRQTWTVFQYNCNCAVSGVTGKKK